MTRKGQFLPDGTADLFEPELSQALKGRTKRAADIVTPPRALQMLEATPPHKPRFGPRPMLARGALPPRPKPGR